MSRRGYTLAELLVVMGMTSVIFTVGVGIVHRVMHQQKFADRDNVMHRVAERVSTRLREDVNRAIGADLNRSGDQGEQRLELNQPDQRIVTYTVRESVLEREATRQSEPTHRDSFHFPDNYRLEFFDVATEQVTFTAYAIPQTYLATSGEESGGFVSESDVRRAVMRVEASVGRDHRFLTETKEAE